MTKWISVKDQMPKDEQKVLFFVRDRENMYAGQFFSERQRFEENLDGWWFDEENITHWMPLPEPPKEII